MLPTCETGVRSVANPKNPRHHGRVYVTPSLDTARCYASVCRAGVFHIGSWVFNRGVVYRVEPEPEPQPEETRPATWFVVDSEETTQFYCQRARIIEIVPVEIPERGHDIWRVMAKNHRQNSRKRPDGVDWAIDRTAQLIGRRMYAWRNWDTIDRSDAVHGAIADLAERIFHAWMEGGSPDPLLDACAKVDLPCAFDSTVPDIVMQHHYRYAVHK